MPELLRADQVNSPQQSPRPPTLVIRGLSKAYGASEGADAAGSGRRRVIRDLDFELAAGEYVAIMGESGIGKSTLLNLIAGLDVPDSGSIALGGVELSSLDDRARTLLRRRDIGFVFQAFHLLPRLSIAQNVALPLHLLDVPRDEAAARTQQMLERLNLADRAADLPRKLSSGQMQRVAIGRALIHRPRLVLADEPTGNLDPDNSALVLELLRAQLAATDAAAVLVTHSRAAAATTQRTLVMTASGLRPAAGPA